MTSLSEEGGAEFRADMQPEVQSLSDALVGVAARDPELAVRLSRVFTAVAVEASRGPRFANALSKALREPEAATSTRASASTKRAGNRRNPGPFDPFAVYAEGQEALLRQRLDGVDLEGLRDILAEHGMDNDRLAMKWKDPKRVVDRIVERVADRSAKGSAFRG